MKLAGRHVCVAHGCTRKVHAVPALCAACWNKTPTETRLMIADHAESIGPHWWHWFQADRGVTSDELAVIGQIIRSSWEWSLRYAGRQASIARMNISEDDVDERTMLDTWPEPDPWETA